MAQNNIQAALKKELDENLYFGSDPYKMNPSEVLDEIKKMNRLRQIKTKYKDCIKQRSDGRVYVYINRQQFVAKNEDDLYQKIYDSVFGIENYSMDDLFQLWILWKRDNTPVTGKTLEEYSRDYEKYYHPHDISKKKLREISSKDVVNLFREWTKRRGITSKQFCNLKSIINGIYSYAITELEIVDANPVKNIDTRQFALKPVDNDDDVFSENERRILLDYLKDDESICSLAIQFAFQVPIRIGELKALKWQNIHDNRIYVNGQCLSVTTLNDDGTFEKHRFENVSHVKGNTSRGYRNLPLNTNALNILEKVRARGSKSQYIFVDGDGKQLHTNRFNRWLRRYCDHAGVSYHSSHKIRFCVASILYKNGVPITALQRMLGHTTVQMTMHYLRNVLSYDDTAEIVENALK